MMERIDEMIERKRIRNGEVSAKMEKKIQSAASHAAIYLTEQLIHGMEVSNLAYDLARELGMKKKFAMSLQKRAFSTTSERLSWRITCSLGPFASSHQGNTLPRHDGIKRERYKLSQRLKKPAYP